MSNNSEWNIILQNLVSLNKHFFHDWIRNQEKKNHFDCWQSKMIFNDQVFGQVADMRSSGVGRLVYHSLYYVAL